MGDIAARLDRSAADAALDRFFEAFYRQRPVTATFTGIHDHDHRLPDWSAAGLEAQMDELRALRRDLEAVRYASAGPAFPVGADLAVADAVLEIALAEHDSGHFVHSNPTLWIGEVTFGVLGLLTRPFAPLAQRLASAQQRLEATPRFLAQARDTVLGAPQRWLQRADAECATVVELFRVTLPEWVSQQVADGLAPGIDPAAWTAAATTAATTLKEFVEHVHRFSTARRGIGSVASSAPPTQAAREAVSADLLSLLVARGHGVTTPLPQLLAEATEALAEARAGLERLAAPYGGWAGAQAAIAAEHPSPERYLARFHERWQECFAVAAANELVTWPAAPLRYVPYPAHVAAAAPQLYYLHYRSPAPFDLFGTFDYVVPGLDGLTDAQAEARLKVWNESAITLNHVVHHGAIGHHVQNHHAYRGASRLGRVTAVDAACRIAMFPGGSLAEGWACYVCDLMEEVGFLTPLEAIAQQHTRLRIAARAVADLSLHTGRFDVPSATLHYEDHALMSPAAARGEAVRNSMYPGTAVMYWLGTRGIHQLRAEVTRREGAAFSRRAFHDRLLSHGALPVALIARLILTDEVA